MSSHLARAALLACLLLATAFANPGQAPAATAELRVFHGRPGTGPLDLRIDGVLRLRRVVEATATDYLQVAAGRHALVVRRSTGARVALTRLNVVLDAGGSHTLALTGPPTRPSLRLLRDDRRTLRVAARLRLVHLLPGLRAVRMVLGGTDGPTVDRLSFGRASPFRRVVPSRFNGGVLPLDLFDAAGGATLARVRLGVRTGRAYSVFVIPARSTGLLRLILAQDS